MKYFLFLLLVLPSKNFSQQILSAIGDLNYPQNNVYYADLNNVLDPFVGTYLYTNGSTSFKIVLQKKTHSSVNNIYYEDMLIGAYRYVKNGVETVNTLNDLTSVYADGTYYPISGRILMTGQILGCDDCSPNEKWIYGSIEDPNSGSVDNLFIMKRVINGQEALKITIHHEMTSQPESSPAPLPISYPLGQEFILVKQ
jgi:hypothetical protein